MSLWVFAALAASALQAFRFYLQKRLSAGGAGPVAATFARFVYAPLFLGSGLLVWWSMDTTTALPALDATFWPWAIVGGIAQIAATILVVATFSRRNFAVGIALSKTTVLMTILTGFALLGEVPTLPVIAAISVGVVGVLAISIPKGQSFRAGMTDVAILYGLGSGAFFSVSAVAYRAGSLAVAAEEPILRASVTLFWVTLLQTALLAAWLLLRDRGAMVAVFRRWRVTLAIGLTSMGGSLGWFTAYTLEQAALVNAVGQVELILSLAISWLLLSERITWRELVGTVLIGFSVVVVLLA
ncbi:DMT family transporter [Jannaschia sp. LMIT008]|uniref:DMT family transporter n=1 Tax=Jannaschia maritima TaxID=3032585 RepID=UPI002811C1C6|nr:DMT family transporter [Jannaschia sp. LMIT008]